MSNPPNDNLPQEPILEQKVENNAVNSEKDNSKLKLTAKEIAAIKAEVKAEAQKKLKEQLKAKSDAKKLAKEQAKSKLAAQNGNSEEKKVKHKKPLPQRYLSIATLGVEVGTRWNNHYQQLQMPTATPSNLLLNSQSLLRLIQEQDGLETDKFQNTKALKEVNKLINNGVGQLKKHLKSEYSDQKNLDSFYKEYGLEPDNRGVYTLPNDNNDRMIALKKLVAKLSEPQNPLAGKTFGLVEWTQAKDNHEQEWNASNDIRSNRSNVSNQVVTLLNTVRESLQNVQKYINAVNKPADAKAIKRGLGFLKESI